MNNFYVYGHFRSLKSKYGEAGTPYYIGKGQGNRRFSKNRSMNLPTNIKNNFIFINNLSEENAFIFEKLLIKFYGRIDLGTGCLRNLTDGGEGFSGCIFSENHKRKIGLALKNKPKSEEHRKKLSLNHQGKKHSKETCEKLSLISKCRSFSEETRKKISLSNKGKIVSEETKKKMSIKASKRVGKNNPFFGKHHSEETRRRISENHRKKLK